MNFKDAIKVHLVCQSPADSAMSSLTPQIRAWLAIRDTTFYLIGKLNEARSVSDRYPTKHSVHLALIDSRRQFPPDETKSVTTFVLRQSRAFVCPTRCWIETPMPSASSCLPAVVNTPHPANVDYSIVLELDDRSVVVDRELFRIGSSPVCEIRLSDGPLLHSVIRMEAGIVWIEVDQAAEELNVNWRACRRMALRDGDVISVPGQDITVHHQPLTVADLAAQSADQITQLTAEELCDQILSEQAAVDEFESAQRTGWRKLMAAIRQVATTEQIAGESDSAPAIEFSDDCERVLEQIREVSQMMNGRTQVLDLCESELVTATALLQESQDRVSRQIEDLLDQIGDASMVNELRASA
jgi:predicted SprT family Zn-dependent metalloprotease